MDALVNSPWLFVAPWVWIAFVVGASVLRRKQVGKPIFPKPPVDAIFVEKRTSGRSLKTWWSRLGGANNALLVAVTPKALVVTPQFPFNLMFLPEIYGLEFSVDRHRIMMIRTRSGLFRETLVVEAGDETFELRLRDPQGFRAALAAR